MKKCITILSLFLSSMCANAWMKSVALDSASWANNKLVYLTGTSGTAATTFTAFARTLLDDANASAVQTTLGLVPGTNVQGFSEYLADIALLSPSAGDILYFDGTDWKKLTLGANGYYLKAGASAPSWGEITPTSLGLVIGTNVQAWDAQLDDIAALSFTDGNIIVGNGTHWVAESGVTAQTSLGLVPGTNVQAWDAQLDTVAGWTAAQVATLGDIGTATTAADQFLYTTAADTFAVGTVTATGRSILDDVDVPAVQTTLSLVPGTNIQAYSANLTSLAALSATTGNLILGNAGDWSVLGIGTSGYVLRSNGTTAAWGANTSLVAPATITATGADVPLTLTSDSGTGLTINTTSGYPLQLNLNGTERLRVNGSGQLIMRPGGVGTSGAIFWGDGDTGLYESLDDEFKFRIAGTDYWGMDTLGFYRNLASGGYIKTGAASGTNPCFTFKDDVDTGLGHYGADALSLVVGGVEALRLTEATSLVTVASTAAWGLTTSTRDVLTLTTSTGKFLYTSVGSYIDNNGDFQSGTQKSQRTAYNYTFGLNAGAVLTGDATNNVLAGSGAGAAITTGDDNTAIGSNALWCINSDSQNTAVGSSAGKQWFGGDCNVFLGYSSATQSAGGGNYNVFLGAETAPATTSATGCTAVGYRSQYSATVDSGNTSIGYQSLLWNGDGGDNFAGGTAAIANYATSARNTAVGYTSLAGYGTPASNTGSDCTAVGYKAGYGTATNNQSAVDTYCTFLGSQASRDASIAYTTPLNYATAVGAGATVSTDYSVVLGGIGAGACNVGIGLHNPANRVDVYNASATVGSALLSRTFTAAGAFDDDDVVIKRDVDGASSYAEAGAVLHLWRDITNVTVEGGSFLECSTDGATALMSIGKDGTINTDHLNLLERSSDPSEPASGRGVIWCSDGTGKGDAGDICMVVNHGGTTKWAVVFDYSAGSSW